MVQVSPSSIRRIKIVNALEGTKERILKRNVITIHTFTRYTYTKIGGGHNIISVFCQLTNNAHTIHKNTIVTLIATRALWDIILMLLNCANCGTRE